MSAILERLLPTPCRVRIFRARVRHRQGAVLPPDVCGLALQAQLGQTYAELESILSSAMTAMDAAHDGAKFGPLAPLASCD